MPVHKAPIKELARSQTVERGQLKKVLHNVRRSADYRELLKTDIAGQSMAMLEFLPSKTVSV